MPIPPVEVVWLSDLKIAGLKINPNQTTYETFLQPSTGAITQSLPQGPIEGTVPGAARPKPYERLAADKPGEELAPDAGIWQLYVEEATEHDTELVKAKNANLDVMLLFAALFSAILTAFLIESKNLLQEDSGELTVALLLAIAQSQQRIEQNNPQILPLVEHPKFSPPASARWINGLWFTALSLSLAAALIAMLAKEWLITFTSSRSRSARAYAHLHQQQLQGMKKWRALHIMDLLPSMLHLSLLLFSLGFAVYLWTLDTAIAIAGVVVSATALIFYVTTVVMGAVYESCPFETQISKYMRTTLRLFRLGRLGPSRPPSGREIDTPMDLLEKDLPALLWLTDYASDPAVSDCACQALAGLSAADISALAVTSDEMLSAIVEPTSIIRNIKAHGPFGIERLVSRILELQHNSSPAQNRYILVKSLFDHVCIRLHDSNTRQQRDLKACQGINIARYSGALPMLVQYLETNSEDIPLRDRRGIQGANPAFSRPAHFAFTAMDTVWNDDYPELSPEAYALLISADLRLTEVVTRIYYSEPDQNSTRSPRHATQISALGGSSTRLINDLNSITVDVQHNNNTSLREVTSLHELRARYSRTLARASILISLQNSEFVTIGPSSLAYLLESMGLAAQSDVLSPLSGLSTAFPQSEATHRNL